MVRGDAFHDEESLPLTKEDYDPRSSEDLPHPSPSSASTTSLVFEQLSSHNAIKAKEALYSPSRLSTFELEDNAPWHATIQPADRRARRWLYICVSIGLLGWVAALFLFIRSGAHKPMSSRPHDPHATETVGHGQKVTLEQVLTGQWYPQRHAISWISGANGEDGLLLKRGGEEGRNYLVVEDVRDMHDVEASKKNGKTLMELGGFWVEGRWIGTQDAWPSPDLETVLVQSDYQKNWRHSNTATYYLFNVAGQLGEALDLDNRDGRIQLVTWSPQSDAVVFTRNNNLYLRKLSESKVVQITTDGGPQLFYGVPDWVYEEEVFSGNSATWFSGDGKYIAFLRTDESAVPEFPVQYYFSRPSGKQPKEGEEQYPDVRQIKYPKAGAPMSVVTLQFYDVAQGEIFTVPIEDDFADNDRLITEVVWAGTSGKVIIRATNRVSDVLKVIVIDAERRTGKTVRETDVKAIDGGWFEVSEYTKYIASDPANGRPHDGYIDTVIYKGYDHLAYFTPLDNPDPIMLTQGEWEVVSAPSALDLENNLVYFVSTQKSPIERHLYSVKLDGTDLKPVTDVKNSGYYGASFSAKAGFALLSYQGPGIPWQKVINTPGNSQTTDILLEDNKALNELATRTELPIELYSTITVDGFELDILERRPPHFDPKKTYPVLFYLYNGPGFQEVDHRFTINFQSYVASSLGYIVVTLDGRGSGYRGRATRCIVRNNIGYWESHDQIAAAKMWAEKPYVDAERMAIWGWSYGGFMTLKTLEQDAGQTFKYGMAVAPVTDWRYYDSIYTERYMGLPQDNVEGYNNATIANATALGENVRFLVMHGASDDNVHLQNTLSLLDKLDLANVWNYDVHVFPDSDHSIYFHNANRVVFEKLSNWLVNAFNGEWLRTDHPVPMAQIDGVA